MMPDSTAPFHDGECAVQTRVGVRERLAELGPRVIRDYMPDQHRTFFTQLPFVIIGAVDQQGQPWASILVNPPGFIQSPDARTLHFRASLQAYDPLHGQFGQGSRVGLLGIEPHTRRRNRMNGMVETMDKDGFSVSVRESFGNCPKYIQAREPEYLPGQRVSGNVHRSQQLDAAALALVLNSDTFFIATSYLPANPGDRQGVDVSHRGGKPGFIKLDQNGTLTVPDFAGNLFFNTLGNLSVNPRAGLLFIDFEHGDLLYLAVTAQIIWDAAEIAAHEGAERLLRFRVLESRRIKHALPLRWGRSELSPVLQQMGEEASGVTTGA